MIRQPLRPIALLVALLAVALPASAAAAVRFSDPYKGNDQAAAIDLAGERIVATETLSDDVPTPRSPRRVGVFAAPLSGAGPWRLLHSEMLRTKPGQDFVAFAASASASRLALSREALGEEFDEGVVGLGASLRAGPLGGSLAPLLTCPKSNLLPAPAVDGRLVAYAGCSSSTITVRDPRQPASSARAFSFGDSVSQLALAGRYLAVLLGGEDEEEETADGEVVLIDHATRRTVLRAPIPTAEGLAVQDDGTVAVSLRDDSADTPACQGYRVNWFSPDRPSPQSLAEPACDERIRIAVDRIAYLAGGRADQRLVLAKLDGSPGHTVARSVQSRRFPFESFDWDGTRVAYGEERCGAPGTIVAGPDEPTQTFGPLECPIEILSDSARLARDNSVGIRVLCKNGCGGELAFSNPAYLHYNVTPGRFVRFSVPPGKARTVRIRLSTRQAARLRRAGSVRARAKVISPYDNKVKDLVVRAP